MVLRKQRGFWPIALLVVGQFTGVGNWLNQAHASAGAVMDPRLARLAKVEEISGRFTQQRTLKGLSRPLIATGEFAYWRNQGLYWHTLTPLETSLLASPTAVTTGLPGSARQQMSGQIESRTTALIFALFAMDLAQLQRDFTLDLSWQGERWRLRLTPSNTTMALAVATVVLAGGNQVDTIELTSKAGDITLIQLLLEPPQPHALEQLRRWLTP